MWKGGATKLKKEKHSRQRERQAAEDDNKARVRNRDRRCRFPLCGCHALKLALKAFPEVSHSKHKSMGGNPSGDRSLAELMVYLCKHRHQDGPVSRHKGTMRALPLTTSGYDGPVSWQLEADILGLVAVDAGETPVPCRPFSDGPFGRVWVEIARESSVGTLLPFEFPWQEGVCRELAKMDW